MENFDFDSNDDYGENRRIKIAIRFVRRALATVGGGAGTWYGILYFFSGRSIDFGPFALPHLVGLAVAGLGVAFTILGITGWELKQKPGHGTSVHDSAAPSATSWKTRH